MLELKPNLSIQRVKSKISGGDREDVRESEKRRDRLEKMAVMHTGKEIYVQISGDKAYADIADSSSELGYTDRIIINVRADIPEQSQTDLDEDTWDFLVQKTDLYHELGHVKWTDWPSFEKVLLGDGNGNFGIRDGHQSMFKMWADLIEDAAIERLLVDRYNIKDDLRISNENLIKNSPPDTMISLNEAVSYALLEYKHPVGWVDKLLDESDDEFQFLTDQDREIFEDEILPEIESRVPDIVEEPDPEERNIQIWQFYDAIADEFDEAITPGEDSDVSFDFPDDHEDMGDESEGEMPSADEMPDVEIESPDQKMEMEVQQDYGDKVEEDQDESDDSEEQMDSYEDWVKIIDKEYDEDVALSLKVPDDPPKDGSFDQSVFNEAQRLSKPLAKELKQRLRHEQRTQKQRKKKSGKVDSKRAHKTQQGQTNIFKKNTDPDEKDYSCALVLDRSGSVSSHMMPEMEKSTGALAMALEEIGVNVAQLSLYQSSVWLEKDFSESVDQAKEKMFRGVTSGGTPLSDALGLSDGRLQLAGSHPFMIVVTDGEPDHRERYRDRLHECDFPVMGVYVNSSGDFNEQHVNENAYFHALELREYRKAIDGVKNLVKQVMF